MAEGSSPTKKLYAACALWLQAGTGADRPTYMCLDSGSMAAFNEATNAPASEISDGTGLERATATLTIQDSSDDLNDECQCYKIWTVTSYAGDITGAEGMSATKNGDNMLWWHRWAATLSGLAAGDTIAETAKLQFLLGT